MPAVERQPVAPSNDLYGLLAFGVFIDLLAECCAELIPAREAAIKRGHCDRRSSPTSAQTEIAAAQPRSE